MCSFHLWMRNSNFPMRQKVSITVLLKISFRLTILMFSGPWRLFGQEGEWKTKNKKQMNKWQKLRCLTKFRRLQHPKAIVVQLFKWLLFKLETRVPLWTTMSSVPYLKRNVLSVKILMKYEDICKFPSSSDDLFNHRRD